MGQAAFCLEPISQIPEFTAAEVRRWLEQLGVGTLFSEPGSPWENGYVESFNGKFRAELRRPRCPGAVTLARDFK
jgi:transposase InsO family protein